ncbi:uncharacterized protein LOC121869183 isoform X2 [Homarus americanus]|nr:uncharacterized protein LOC121869183 isoform X2 [Homarus americanus]XP_042226346.1 uncharacterized protein LOC121869183 isoform X2 [Homarus americanus]
MSSDTLTLPTDIDVHESITNIAIWLETHSHAGPQQTPEEITAEDLAVAVPGECLFPELCAENEEASHEEEKGVLVYTDSNEDKYIWLKGDWHPLEGIEHYLTKQWMGPSTSIWGGEDVYACDTLDTMYVPCGSTAGTFSGSVKNSGIRGSSR